MSKVLNNSTVLITGATGSFGNAFVRFLLKKPVKAIRIFSRDEFKQDLMAKQLNDKRLRFLLGDVRDLERLKMATRGVDVLVHAAALKQIPAAEYNPMEPIKTNILGTKNVIDACLENSVKKAILISSDKAAHPINLYGATKLCAERLFIQANVYTGKRKTRFSVVRYGNVLGSRGSVVPLFIKQKEKGLLTITHEGMTRFWITLDQACKLVGKMIGKMKGGEIFIPLLPSINVVDLAYAIAPKAKLKVTGIRPGEKLHEELVTEEESSRITKLKNHMIINPQYPYWKTQQSKRGRPRKLFSYTSGNNTWWLKRSELKKMLKAL